MKRVIKKVQKHVSRIRETKQDKKFFVTATILTVLTAMLLALWIGMRQSIWFDEAYSILAAQQPIRELLGLVAADTHPPLYYMMLQIWASIFGWSELALRTLSVLFYGGSIAFAAALARYCFGSKAAVGALLFLVFAPLLMRYGFEIRMYAMASFIGIAATYVMVKAMNVKKSERTGYWILYAVLIALGVYTLYYTVLLWIAHLVWLTWMTYRNKKGTVKLTKLHWPYAIAGGAVLFLPWLPTFLKQINNGALAPIAQQMNFENIVGIASFNYIYRPLWQLELVTSLLIIFALITSMFVLVRAAKVVVHREYFVLLACYVAVPVILLVIVSFFRPMYTERYLSHIAIGGITLMGVSVWLAEQYKPSRMMRASAALLLVVIFVGFTHLVSVGNYNFQRMQKPNVEQVANNLQTCHDGDAIVAADPYVAIELMAVLPNCQVHFYSQHEKLGGGYALLSESKQRVESPVGFLGNKKVHYVYYGQPKIQFSDQYTPTERRSIGPMTISSFKATAE